MRYLTKSTLGFPLLSSLVLCQQHVHANIHNKRDLSDIIESALGPGYENIASQIEGQLEGGGFPSGVVVTTIIAGGNAGPGGVNSGWYKDPPQPTGAVFVTTSIQGAVPGTEAGAQNGYEGGVAGGTTTTIVAGNPAYSAPPAAIEEPTTTLQSIVQLISTVTVAPTPLAGDTTTIIYETQQMYSTVTHSPASVAASSPPPVEVPQPSSVSTPPPIAPPATLLVSEPTQAPPVATSVSPLAIGSPGGMASGTGTILPNGACDCICLCGIGSFPSPTPSLPVIISNGTTLQTVISAPTPSVSLIGSILVDTSPPPVPAGETPSTFDSIQVTSNTPINLATTSTYFSSTSTETSSYSSTITESTIIPSADSTTTTTPPIQSAVTNESSPTPTSASADSTIRFSLTGADLQPQPTAAPEVTGTEGENSSIDISKYTLASSLVLGNLGI